MLTKTIIPKPPFLKTAQKKPGRIRAAGIKKAPVIADRCYTKSLLLSNTR